jgi:uncharacterized protein YyaL (SSP411 family)
MLVALAEHLDPPEQVIIRGPGDEAARWRDSVTKKYSPMRQVFAIDSQAQGLPEALAAKRALDGCVAYVCRGTTCSEPIKALAPLLALSG